MKINSRTVYCLISDGHCIASIKYSCSLHKAVENKNRHEDQIITLVMNHENEVKSDKIKE